MNESQQLATVPPTPQAIEQVRNTAVQPVAAITRAELVFFGDLITAAGLVPPDKNVTPEVQKYRVMAKVVAGAAHGFDPISSQENLHIIQGRCVLSARGMAIKLRRTGKYDVRTEVLNDEICTLVVWERNAESKWNQIGKVSFSYQDAVKAGLAGDQVDSFTGKPKKGSNDAMYQKWRQDMLFGNAMKRVCRRCAPEVLDTDPLTYRLSVDSAKEDAPPPSPPPPPPPALNEAADTPASETPDGEGYSEIPYADTDTLSDAADAPGSFDAPEPGEPVDAIPGDDPTAEPVDETAPSDEPETPQQELARLIANAEAFLVEVAGSVPSKAEQILNGRIVGLMDKKQVVAFIEELEKIQRNQ